MPRWSATSLSRGSAWRISMTHPMQQHGGKGAHSKPWKTTLIIQLRGEMLERFAGESPRHASGLC